MQDPTTRPIGDLIPTIGDDDDPFIVLTETKFSFRCRRGFTSWDEDDDVERVVPLVLGARPGTRDYWMEFKNLRLNSFECLPQATLEHLPSKMLNSLTCTDSLADLFKKKGGLFAPSRS